VSQIQVNMSANEEFKLEVDEYFKVPFVPVQGLSLSHQLTSGLWDFLFDHVTIKWFVDLQDKSKKMTTISVENVHSTILQGVHADESFII
jgi:hypothetical protein